MPRFGQRSRQLEWVALAFRDHVRRRIGKIRRYSKGQDVFRKLRHASLQFGGGLNAGHMQNRSHHRKRLRVDAPRNRQIGDSALELLNQPGCVFVAALAAKTDALKVALDEIEVTERNSIIGTT